MTPVPPPAKLIRRGTLARMVPAVSVAASSRDARWTVVTASGYRGQRVEEQTPEPRREGLPGQLPSHPVGAGSAHLPGALPVQEQLQHRPAHGVPVRAVDDQPRLAVQHRLRGTAGVARYTRPAHR